MLIFLVAGNQFIFCKEVLVASKNVKKHPINDFVKSTFSFNSF